MDIFTLSFFGHRYLDDFRATEDKLTDLITGLLQEKEYVEFLVGRDGDFDQVVTSTFIREKRLYGSNSSSLIWVLPYSTADLERNLEAYEGYYDEIEICEVSADSHPKAAIQKRNRNMVDRSDLVVCYVDHETGGAYQTMSYATRQGKHVINLAQKKPLLFTGGSRTRLRGVKIHCPPFEGCQI